jgi:hypothetical protein
MGRNAGSAGRPPWHNSDTTTLRVRTRTCFLSIALLWASKGGASSVPSLSFEELTDRSELVVTGHVTRVWTDWDSEHKYIWTHYELTVSATHKGFAVTMVVVSEPGGVVGIQGMAVAGAVTYQPAEDVVVFLQRMPNGYLRTTGWSQGKFDVDAAGRLRPQNIPGGVEFASPAGVPLATSLRTLNGMTVAQLHARIAAHLGPQGRKK